MLYATDLDDHSRQWTEICIQWHRLVTRSPTQANQTLGLPSLSLSAHILTKASPKAFPSASASGTGTAFPICRCCWPKKNVHQSKRKQGRERYRNDTYIYNNCRRSRIDRYKLVMVWEPLGTRAFSECDDALLLSQIINTTVKPRERNIRKDAKPGYSSHSEPLSSLLS
jgi:hypothetical protein